MTSKSKVVEKELKMYIPKEIAVALSRCHNGREDITNEEILDAISKMNFLYEAYKKASEKLNYCEDVWWEKMKIESYFKEPRWYYAHRKRKALETKVKELHKEMFYLMVHTDGNYEPFGSGAMWADDIHSNFTRKYLKRLTQ